MIEDKILPCNSNLSLPGSTIINSDKHILYHQTKSYTASLPRPLLSLITALNGNVDR